MKFITSVFFFILAASFSLGTQVPENGWVPADTKIRIPQATRGDPDTRRDSDLFIAPAAPVGSRTDSVLFRK